MGILHIHGVPIRVNMLGVYIRPLNTLTHSEFVIAFVDRSVFFGYLMYITSLDIDLAMSYRT